MRSGEVERIRRMWAELSDEPMGKGTAEVLADRLALESLPSPRPHRKAEAITAALAAAKERTVADVADDRSFRRLLDQGTPSVGTWRIVEAVRPQLGLLSWSYWLIAVLLFVAGTFALPRIEAWGPGALIVTVPLLGLVSLLYTVRPGSQRVREWERSCPITTFQIALGRVTLVLGTTLSLAAVASLLLLRQDFGVQMAALTVSWLAPLLLIVGLYMVADVRMGNLAGPTAAIVGWFVHLILTEGGRSRSSIASAGTTVSTYDALLLLLGAASLLTALLLTSTSAGESDEHPTP